MRSRADKKLLAMPTVAGVYNLVTIIQNMNPKNVVVKELRVKNIEFLNMISFFSQSFSLFILPETKNILITTMK